MRVAVIGAGYVGLVAAVCLAAHNRVTLVERNRRRLGELVAGRVPFHEAGSEVLLARHRERIDLVEGCDDTLRDCAVAIVAVGTPADDTGSVDLSALHTAVDALAPVLADGALLLLKSTVPVGTARVVQARLAAAGRPGIIVGSNPEFLREGSAVADFLRPSRVLVGVDGPLPASVKRLYAPFVAADRPLMHVDSTSAELAKYAANAALASRVAFINELSRLADVSGADVHRVRDALATDPRIGDAFLDASLGFGGSCFPKDLRALRHMAEAEGVRAPLLDGIAHSNALQLDHWFARIEQRLGSLAGLRIAVWGLAFKAGTDDVRESAAVALVDRLLAAGAEVVAHDPRATLKRPGLTVVDDSLEALEGASALLISTEWPEYAELAPDALVERLSGGVVFDGRNIFEASEMVAAGLEYHCIGRPSGSP